MEAYRRLMYSIRDRIEYMTLMYSDRVHDRKGSKQLTDEERASEGASPTIPPENKGDDNEGEESNGRPPFFGPEVMQGVREAQK